MIIYALKKLKNTNNEYAKHQEKIEFSQFKRSIIIILTYLLSVGLCKWIITKTHMIFFMPASTDIRFRNDNNFTVIVLEITF